MTLLGYLVHELNETDIEYEISEFSDDNEDNSMNQEHFFKIINNC